VDPTEPFHPESFRAGSGPLPAAGARASKRPPRHRQGERFLRGPVPWPWLLAAGACTGKALHVALALWHEAGIARSRTIPFRPARAREFGMSRDTARRGLRELERAGRRNTDHQAELRERLKAAAMPCDLAATVQVAKWVYQQTEKADGQVWVTEKVLRHLGPEWSRCFAA
jgi:hypothetical protein